MQYILVRGERRSRRMKNKRRRNDTTTNVRLLPAMITTTSSDRSSAAFAVTLAVALMLILHPEHAHVSGHRHNKLRYGQHDPLIVTRCEAECWIRNNRSPCVRSCLQRGNTKPGDCPGSETALQAFAAVCLDGCKEDWQCPELEKCCRHHCGVTCQEPSNLNSTPGLPEVPADVTVREGQKRRTVIVEWRPSSLRGDDVVLYLIEERHHAGRHLIESRMTEWTPSARTSKPYARQLIKPGRWYQYRVAAVNANGTRGFSRHSFGFIASTGPRPPKIPENVTIGPLWVINSSLNAELKWTPPTSDLPVQRYKVFWSRRLHGVTALDSVLVHQQTVSKDQTTFLLQNLKPNALYFIQIQALSQFGKERLKGKKAELFLNTTNFVNNTDNNIQSDGGITRRIESVHMQKLFWSRGSLRARIVWKHKSENSRYTVSWWSRPFRNNDQNYANLKLVATTMGSHFDLYDLQFNSKYRVSVKEIALNGSDNMKSIQDTSITFITPSCENFKLKNSKTQCL